jgi:hypothetical protein
MFVAEYRSITHHLANLLLLFPCALQFLVALQAALTVIGNTTCWWAAYRIFRGAQEQGA